MNTMNTDDFDSMTHEDRELLASLHRSVAGATLAADTADVVALGRRTRNRHRAVAAGIGTSAAAIVAAIGVLAPSAGTGAGSGAVPNAASQKAVATHTDNAATTPSTGQAATTPGADKPATTPGTAQTLHIEEAGFTMDEQADGTVHLTITQIMDPALLQSALTKAGVPAAILVQQVPKGWDLSKGIECTPDPGVIDAGAAGGFKIRPGKGGYDFVIDKAAIPAGDYMTVLQFQDHGRQMGTQFGMKVGRQTTCVPRYSDSNGIVND